MGQSLLLESWYVTGCMSSWDKYERKCLIGHLVMSEVITVGLVDSFHF